MLIKFNFCLAASFVMLGGLFLSTNRVVGQDAVSFSREVLPILSDRCFHCHGPDEGHRKAKLRLDQEEDAKRKREGLAAITPGSLEESVVWQRIITGDKDELMPPADSHRKPLTKKEQAILKQWLLEGAKWGKHWAFEKPKRSAVPHLAEHPIDAFVQKRLASENLKPSPPASPHTQLRRLSFDLTGLPPTPQQVADFERNPSSENWAKSVDRLLESPHHGERLAMWWLDAARYSDTDGYQGDAERKNWPWRDWVIEAFNSNMPFDQFTLEQFGGDLLPNATPEQIIATCFHRNHMTNGEGGRVPEESRIDYVIDRLNTTGTVWLGLTLGCTQCHSHKFDPVSHKDYYSLFAFFNSIDEDGNAGNKAKPYLAYESSHTQRAINEMTDHLNSMKKRETVAKTKATHEFKSWLENTFRDLPEGYKAWQTVKPTALSSAEGTTFEIEKHHIVQTGGPSPRQEDYRIIVASPKSLSRITGWKLEVFPHPSHTDGKLTRGENGEFILTNVKLLVQTKGESQVREIELKSAVADFEPDTDGSRKYAKVKDTLDDDPRNGWTTKTGDPLQPHSAIFELEAPLVLAPDEELIITLLHRSTGGKANIGRFRISLSDQVGETVRSFQNPSLEELAAKKPASTDAINLKLRQRLLEQFLLDQAPYQHTLKQFTEARRQLGQITKAKKSNVMVLGERKEARDTHILVRGVWDAKGDKVKRAMLPAVLPWPEEKSRTRLDLARWLTAPDNPLTARVTVNHLWQLMFGEGLTRTPDDFGLQGEMPSHPELLDWLAVELVEKNWDLRHILRLIATSDTYRQSSHISADSLERDPDNRLLARAPRFRLPAWMIRDNALSVAGLLNPALGGPPVKPWQPDGVWKEIFMGRFTYKPSVGPAQYRRTIYAFWRRSSAPTFLFDNAQRRICTTSTNRTNTPLHALTLLNDTSMLESSRGLADLSLAQSNTPVEGIQFMARRILSRNLTVDEAAVFQREYKRAFSYYSKTPSAATQLTTIGQHAPASSKNVANTAARMTIASMMLNLDEAITHE